MISANEDCRIFSESLAMICTTANAAMTEKRFAEIRKNPCSRIRNIEDRFFICDYMATLPLMWG